AGVFTEAYVRYAVRDPAAPPPPAVLASWFQSWYWFPLVTLALVFVPLLFPSGRPPSPAWRPVAWLAAGSTIVFAALSALQETIAVRDTDVVITNPLGIQGLDNPEETSAGLLPSLLVAGCILAAVASVVVRFRRSRGDERQQLKWFTFAAALLPLQIAADQVIPDTWQGSDFLFALTIAALPVACGIGVLKYRLYDIDLVINRTLVYGGLTAAVVAFYVAVVTGFDLVLRRSGVGVSLVATALVAVFFQPVRERLQSAVDRLMYGETRDPYRVLSRLGKRLEAVPAVEQMLPSLVESVAQAMRVPYVAVELRQGQEFLLLAAHGQKTAGRVDLPLLYQGEVVGRLVVGRRSPGERFSDRDFRLLEDLASHAGSAVNAVRLTAELQVARQNLVAAREEERRRLRRDLHDGLGPALAGIGLQVEAARNLLPQQGELTDDPLADLSDKIEDAVAEIRRLVYGLRPPALDELGLAGALKEQALRFSDGGPAVSVETQGDLASLPAAVEVAAYRITSEAMNNAVRHSGASRCTARLDFNGEALEVDIVDDGKGIGPDRRTGVGIHS
ncbi:MAG TPA: histidine kinase, partial [Actinomycetota bacterium]|nr:histidine kinase [Actinomycetota bacterium]